MSINKDSYPEGLTIVKAREMSEFEMYKEGWDMKSHRPPIALELSDNSVLYPSRDEEGNGPGCMFGKKLGEDGDTVTNFYLMP
jgi:hypothetical protein